MITHKSNNNNNNNNNNDNDYNNNNNNKHDDKMQTVNQAVRPITDTIWDH